MLVKRNLNPVKLVMYVWRPVLYAAGVAVFVLLLRLWWPDARWYALPFAPVAALAGSLALVVAFRANSAYQRWWEARILWQNIVNNCRILARQVYASTEDAMAAGKGGAPDEVIAWRRELTLRLIAFAYALRDELRGTHGAGDARHVDGRRDNGRLIGHPPGPPDGGPDLRRLLSAAEFARVSASARRSNALLTGIGVMIKEGVRGERVGMFDPISLEPNLAALNNWAGGAERIKTTPTPTQYSFFSRMFIATLATLLPFGLVGLLDGALLWWLVPLSTAGSALFIMLERTSEINDAPFANATTDVPMTALCVGLERDLRDQLADAEVPAAPVPVNGYLW